MRKLETRKCSLTALPEKAGLNSIEAKLLNKVVSSVILCATVGLAASSACFGDATVDSSAVVQHHLKPLITFALDADQSNSIRNVLFRLAKAAVQQTGQTVTVEVGEGQTNSSLPLIPQASDSAVGWLKKLKLYAPSLTWYSSGQKLNVFLPAARPYDRDGKFLSTSQSYDPLSTKIPTSYFATLTVDQWYTWLLKQVPYARLYIDDTGYGNTPNIGYKTGLPNQKVHLSVAKGATIRQFLTDLTSGLGGSWTADIYGPLEPITKPGQAKTSIFRQLNTVYLFRPGDPFS